MSCPMYEGNYKCALKSPGEPIPSDHILSYCCHQGGEYLKCDIFVQLKHTRKASEILADQEANPLATFEGYHDPTVQMHHRAQRKLQENNKGDLSAQTTTEEFLLRSRQRKAEGLEMDLGSVFGPDS